MRKSILESFLVKDERGDSIPGSVDSHANIYD